MKLYHMPMSRSVRVLWLLEELGEKYDLVTIDADNEEHKKPEYLAINPNGSVPTLVDGDLTIYESAAICAYLADKAPDQKLAPAVGTPERGLYYQWLFYGMTELEPPLLQIAYHTVFLPEGERSIDQIQDGIDRYQPVAAVLSNALQGKEFILGKSFSVADIVLATAYFWLEDRSILGSHPVVEGYVKRLLERPAFQRAIAD